MFPRLLGAGARVSIHARLKMSGRPGKTETIKKVGERVRSLPPFPLWDFFLIKKFKEGEGREGMKGERYGMCE